MESIDLPLEGLVDIRMPIPGNSFAWSPENLEPAAAKKRIVIHATASEAPNEDGFTMAAYHMGPPDSWPGIGVNFVITKDAYPGTLYDGGSCPAGSQIQYVGDCLSIRAGVWNHNPGSIHIEISGLFTPGHGVPSEAQLRNVRKLIDFLLSPNNLFPSLNYYSQVVYHNQIADADHGTECPGWQHPQFNEWFGYLQGGAEPSWFAAIPAPIPVPTPAPAPAPVPEPTPSGSVLADEPEYKQTWKEYTQPVDKTITRPDAFAVDASGAKAPIPLELGRLVKNIVGEFQDNGKTYYRSAVARDNGTWYGVEDEYFQPLTGQVPDAIIPVQVVKTDTNNLRFTIVKALAALFGAILKVITKRRNKNA